MLASLSLHNLPRSCTGLLRHIAEFPACSSPKRWMRIETEVKLDFKVLCSAPSSSHSAVPILEIPARLVRECSIHTRVHSHSVPLSFFATTTTTGCPDSSEALHDPESQRCFPRADLYFPELQAELDRSSDHGLQHGHDRDFRNGGSLRGASHDGRGPFFLHPSHSAPIPIHSGREIAERKRCIHSRPAFSCFSCLSVR